MVLYASYVHCPRIGILSSCLIGSGILNHVEGRGKCDVGWWPISLNLYIYIHKGKWLEGY